MTQLANTLLNVLLPGDDDFPPADTLGLAGDLSNHSRFATPLRTVATALPRAFVCMSADDKMAAVKQLETTMPVEFDALIVGLYSLYYTHQKVAGVIERLTGHSANPPQPNGHTLAPFNRELLAIPAGRAPHFRPTPKEST